MVDDSGAPPGEATPEAGAPAATAGTPEPGTTAEPGKKQRRRKSESAKKGNAKADVYMAMVTAMLGTPNQSLTVPFDERLAVLEDAAGERKPFRIGDGEVLRPLAPSAVRGAVQRYGVMALGGTGKDILPVDATQIATMWQDLATPIAETDVAAVRQLSEPGYCWHRLPWDIDGAVGETPTWDEMMGRTLNADALMAWLGGLITPDTDRQQYVYIYGPGRNGKGSLSRFLHQVFAGAYRAETTEKANQFWTSGLVGARIVVFPDFSDPTFPDKGFFKMLTGGDPVRIEKKTKDPFTMMLAAKFMFLSNERPRLSSGAANARRAIFCEMAPLPVSAKILGSAAYDALLFAEGPAFLAKCKARWAELAPHGYVEVRDEDAKEAYAEVVEAHEEDLMFIAQKWLTVGADLKIEGFDMQKVLLAEGLRSGRDQGRWFRFLENRHGVRKIRDRGADGSRPWRYRGCGLREGMRPALDKF